MLAALLGVLFLLNAATSQAQTTVWSATLTVADIGFGQSVGGCDNGVSSSACSSTTVLTDDDFTYDGVEYHVVFLQVDSGFLRFHFDKAIPAGLKAALILDVGTSQFPLANANINQSNRNLDWANSGLSHWPVGDTVSLSLVEPPPLPTVSLSASPDPVPEGDNVTVTATLSEALSELVEIPLLPAWNTGTVETGDIKGPSGTITVFHGKTTGEEPVLTVRDCDTDDEMFTVALDTARLPSSLRAGTQSVKITIKDNGAHCTPTTNQPTDQPPSNTGGTGIGGGGGGGGGLTPPGSDDEPPPEDEEPSTSCPQEDREILGSFYAMTDGEGWDENENWDSTEPLDQWHGVETDDAGEVISLRLADNNLSGNMPTEELLCLNENTELKELALWDNEDLLGEVPEDLALAVERAALRAIAEMFDINPEWFDDYEDPFNFEDWYERVTTDDDGRVVELDLPGEIPESIRSQFKERREITITTSDGGCALSPEGSSAFSLFLLTLVVFAVLGRKRARGGEDVDAG